MKGKGKGKGKKREECLCEMRRVQGGCEEVHMSLKKSYTSRVLAKRPSGGLGTNNEHKGKGRKGRRERRREGRVKGKG